mmetsp:Transcript_113351/g.212384  ORF Transcript_113351/g.212384 Transcript_113351/m.212384 type:complete len:106 (-) Transcript_113351:736-1053(-)
MIPGKFVSIPSHIGPPFAMLRQRVVPNALVKGSNRKDQSSSIKKARATAEDRGCANVAHRLNAVTSDTTMIKVTTHFPHSANSCQYLRYESLPSCPKIGGREVGT